MAWLLFFSFDGQSDWHICLNRVHFFPRLRFDSLTPFFSRGIQKCVSRNDKWNDVWGGFYCHFDLDQMHVPDFIPCYLNSKSVCPNFRTVWANQAQKLNGTATTIATTNLFSLCLQHIASLLKYTFCWCITEHSLKIPHIFFEPQSFSWTLVMPGTLHNSAYVCDYYKLFRWAKSDNTNISRDREREKTPWTISHIP